MKPMHRSADAASPPARPAPGPTTRRVPTDPGRVKRAGRRPDRAPVSAVQTMPNRLATDRPSARTTCHAIGFRVRSTASKPPALRSRRRQSRQSAEVGSGSNCLRRVPDQRPAASPPSPRQRHRRATTAAAYQTASPPGRRRKHRQKHPGHTDRPAGFSTRPASRLPPVPTARRRRGPPGPAATADCAPPRQPSRIPRRTGRAARLPVPTADCPSPGRWRCSRASQQRAATGSAGRGGGWA